MATEIEKDAVGAAYEDVRSDTTDTNWTTLGYEGSTIVVDSLGMDYDEFVSKFEDDQRVFGYVRVFTGDEMSKRAKFALVTWCGANVSTLNRARLSTDKSLVKNIMKNFALEIQPTEHAELTEEYIRLELVKAGGANYGIGS